MELSGAGLAGHFHGSIVSKVTTHIQSADVFNIEVESDHSYIANGVAVHNCLSCVAQHGTEYPLDEPGPLDHPSGRCARAPLTKTWKELGFDIEEPPRVAAETGVEWLGKQPEATQRTIMGPKRFDAWREGKYPPEAWSVRRTNPEWRDSYGVGPVPVASGR